MRTTAPLWSSGFRPFFLFGVAYGAVLMFGWAYALGSSDALPWPAFIAQSWHAREMLFGFATAIVAGVVLAALPSWSGTEELRGTHLAWLAALWCAGRAAIWIASISTWQWIAVVDLLFVPALFASVAPQLMRVANRRYLLLLPVLGALYAAQIASQLASNPGLPPAQQAAPLALHMALHAAVYAIVVLYVLVGGLLTPVFTGNVLRAKGRGEQARFVPALEFVAVALVVVLAVLDLARAPAAWIGAAALACTVVHAWRVLRWKGWRAADVPIVLAMNLGFAWLVAAFALRAAAAFTNRVPSSAWLHAFTVGSLGMMMIGLMTRVVLRHTGRPLAVPPAIIAAGAAMMVAALLRLAAGVYGLGNGPVALAALLWALAFSVWFARFAPMLLAPSLPRKQPAPAASRSAPG